MNSLDLRPLPPSSKLSIQRPRRVHTGIRLQFRNNIFRKYVSSRKQHLPPFFSLTLPVPTVRPSCVEVFRWPICLRDGCLCRNTIPPYSVQVCCRLRDHHGARLDGERKAIAMSGLSSNAYRWDVLPVDPALTHIPSTGLSHIHQLAQIL